MKLPKTDEPIQLTREQQSDVDVQRRVADLRTRFEQCIFSVQTYVKEQGIRSAGVLHQLRLGRSAT